MNDEPECHSCRFVTDRLESYSSYDGKPPRVLCALCAGTEAGRALEYPDQFPDARVLQTICYVGNVILAAIQERQSDVLK